MNLKETLNKMVQGSDIEIEITKAQFNSFETLVSNNPTLKLRRLNDDSFNLRKVGKSARLGKINIK